MVRFTSGRAMNDNETMLRKGYAAFAAGDIPGVLALFDPQIRWTVGGHSSLSGVYTGHEEVVGFFTKIFELTSGTFALDVKRMIVDDNGVVAIVSGSGQRDGKSYSWENAHVWEVKDGKVSTFAEYAHDNRPQDELFA